MNKLYEILTEIQVDIAEIKKDLGYHILRSDQNEVMIKHLEERIEQIPVPADIPWKKVAIVAGLISTVIGSTIAWMKL